MLSMMGGGGAGPKFGGLGGDYNEPSDEDSDDEEMPELDDVDSESAVINKCSLLIIQLFFNLSLLYRVKVKRRKRKTTCPI